jgi:hypothetical protein
VENIAEPMVLVGAKILYDEELASFTTIHRRRHKMLKGKASSNAMVQEDIFR